MADTEYKIQVLIEAQNKASAEIQKLQKDMSALQTNTKSASKQMTTSFWDIAKAIAWLWIIREVTQFINESITAAREQERVNKVLAQTLKITWDAVWYTTDQIEKQAQAIMDSTWISDDAVQAGQNMLLLYKSIGHDVFPQATQAIVDMATAMNSWVLPAWDQLANTAKILWKAMEDPILWMTTLRKQWIMLDDSIKAQIKTLVDHWEKLKASKVLLDDITAKYGGMAEAASNAWIKLSTAWGELKEAVGTSLLKWLDGIAGAILPIVQAVTKWIEANPQLASTLIIVVWAMTTLVWLSLTLWPILALMWISIWWLIAPALWVVAAIWAVVVWLKLFEDRLHPPAKSLEELKKDSEKTSSQIADLNAKFKAGKITLEDYENQLWKLKTKQNTENGLIAVASVNARTYKDAIDALANAKMTLSKIEYQEQKAKILADAEAAYKAAQAFVVLAKAMNQFSPSSAIQKMSWITLPAVSFAGIDYWASAQKQADEQKKIMDVTEADITKRMKELSTTTTPTWWSWTTKTDDQKAALDELAKAMKDYGFSEQVVQENLLSLKKANIDEIKDTWKYFEWLSKTVQESYDKINDKIKDSYDKIFEYKQEIIDLQKEFDTLWWQQTKDVAKEYVNIQEQIKTLTDQIKSDQENYAKQTNVSAEDQAKYQEDQLSKIKEQKALQDSLASAFSGMSEEQKVAMQKQIDDQTAYNAMNPIEKILKDYSDKKTAIQDDINTKLQGIADENTKIQELQITRMTLQKSRMWQLRIDQAEQKKMYADLIVQAQALASAKASANLSAQAQALTWKKADWGSVVGWGTYLVWERWPELFVPWSPWNIIPNSQITNNSPINISINWLSVRSESDIDAIANSLARKIELRRNFSIS